MMASMTNSLSSTSINSTASINSNSTSASTGSSTRIDKSLSFLTNDHKLETRTPTPTKNHPHNQHLLMEGGSFKDRRSYNGSEGDGSSDNIPHQVVNHNNNHVLLADYEFKESDEESLIKSDDDVSVGCVSYFVKVFLIFL